MTWSGVGGGGRSCEALPMGFLGRAFVLRSGSAGLPSPGSNPPAPSSGVRGGGGVTPAGCGGKPLCQGALALPSPALCIDLNLTDGIHQERRGRKDMSVVSALVQTSRMISPVSAILVV